MLLETIKDIQAVSLTQHKHTYIYTQHNTHTITHTQTHTQIHTYKHTHIHAQCIHPHTQYHTYTHIRYTILLQVLRLKNQLL